MIHQKHPGKNDRGNYNNVGEKQQMHLQGKPGERSNKRPKKNKRVKRTSSPAAINNDIYSIFHSNGGLGIQGQGQAVDKRGGASHSNA